jgi:hypothetical protein
VTEEPAAEICDVGRKLSSATTGESFLTILRNIFSLLSRKMVGKFGSALQRSKNERRLDSMGDNLVSQ